jgi:predicted unusual protein kinase regulating ubiquinone biosynthesis (AarF/ABC1/UbiB family)
LTTTPPGTGKGRAIPTGRLNRFVRMGGMATIMAGGMMMDGALALATGKRPRLTDLILTPANALKLTSQLSQMRGAAMKLGQMLSMDAGEFLPSDLAAILGRLRAEAQHMPQRQLTKQLEAAWGKDWRSRFADFTMRPFAAASIGQVHRATLNDGRQLAIKVQYPGVRASIDSDVDNVATLIRLSGLLPRHMDIAPLLTEAKRQLHDEADYAREAAFATRYATHLAGSGDFIVPTIVAELSTDAVIAMDYIEGVPIESLVTASQDVRNSVIERLMRLTLTELFDFRLMQTDPNFANYRYQADTGRIVLLDFGATRDVPQPLADGYRALAAATLAGDDAGVRAASLDLGLLSPAMPRATQDRIVAMAAMTMEPMRAGGLYDFADTSLVTDMREQGMMIAADRRNWIAPPPDTVFIHRKFGGIFLLATRLKARIDVTALITPFISAPKRRRAIRKSSTVA